MRFFHDALHHPRRLWLRRAIFQVHLWAGILLSVYMIVIALTGAVLVFQDELTSVMLPAGLNGYDERQAAPVVAVVEEFQRRFPGAKIDLLTMPSDAVPAFQILAVDAEKHAFNVVGDPVTSALRVAPRSWLNVVHDLHVYLLLGEAYGVQVNGAGAAILLALAVTGLVLWWPGMKTWTRGLRVSFRHSWRRINYDAHSAIGFWTLALVMWWAVSGVYFAWYRQVGFAVNMVSPLKNMVPPTPAAMVPLAAGERHASLGEVLNAAQRVSPAGRLNGLTNATQSEPQLMAMMDLGEPGDFSHRDLVTLDAASGRVLSVWHYGRNQSFGDWVMWAMHPLHFGTLWGLPVKMLWSTAGVLLAVLSATGVLMYWNRYLGKRWQALKPIQPERVKTLS